MLVLIHRIILTIRDNWPPMHQTLSLLSIWLIRYIRQVLTNRDRIETEVVEPNGYFEWEIRPMHVKAAPQPFPNSQYSRVPITRWTVADAVVGMGLAAHATQFFFFFLFLTVANQQSRFSLGFIYLFLFTVGDQRLELKQIITVGIQWWRRSQSLNVDI